MKSKTREHILNFPKTVLCFVKTVIINSWENGIIELYFSFLKLKTIIMTGKI